MIVLEEIRKAYDLNSVLICPHYSPALFNERSIPDILMETNRRGIVAKGFFDRCDYRLSNSELVVEIPFSESGVGFVCDAKTPELMEKLILQEYGTKISVRINRMQDFDPDEYASSVRSQIQALSREAAKAEAQYVQMQQAQQYQPESAPVQEEKDEESKDPKNAKEKKKDSKDADGGRSGGA